MKRGLLVAAAALLLAGCGQEPTPAPPACPTEPPTTVSAQATLEGASIAVVTIGGAVEGEFTIALNGSAAPIATANFVALARCGFYDQVKFHRVLAGFVIQAGDPNTKAHDGDFSGIGREGAGYRYEIELPADELGYDRYSVAMANNTRTNDSQFFVSLDDLNGRLARTYTIFGMVVGGTDIIDAIGAVPVTDPRVGIPATPVWIDSILISDEGGPVSSPGS